MINNTRLTSYKIRGCRSGNACYVFSCSFVDNYVCILNNVISTLQSNNNDMCFDNWVYNRNEKKPFGIVFHGENRVYRVVVK